MDLYSSVLQRPVLSETLSFDKYSAPQRFQKCCEKLCEPFPVPSENSNDDSVSPPLVSADVDTEFSSLEMTNKNKHKAPGKHSHNTSVEICGLQVMIT